ncbi:MAG TPA: hypothetical protein DEO94_00555 [Cyanobacteria bacterium UBA11991]|nr:hypothetical protein [Cyanobacteria bacterium UBA11991]
MPVLRKLLPFAKALLICFHKPDGLVEPAASAASAAPPAAPAPAPVAPDAPDTDAGSPRVCDAACPVAPLGLTPFVCIEITFTPPFGCAPPALLPE